MDIGSILEENWRAAISIIALIVSIMAYLHTRAQRNMQITHSLHKALFNEVSEFKVIYLIVRPHNYYFNDDLSEQGKPGNFIGSEEEANIDLFLERLNFVCMWLLQSRKGSKSEMLFRKHIYRVYKAPFFRDYFSFLANIKDIDSSGTYFPFIHKYAKQRFGMSHPNENYRENAIDVHPAQVSSPEPLEGSTDH